MFKLTRGVECAVAVGAGDADQVTEVAGDSTPAVSSTVEDEDTVTVGELWVALARHVFILAGGSDRMRGIRPLGLFRDSPTCRRGWFCDWSSVSSPAPG